MDTEMRRWTAALLVLVACGLPKATVVPVDRCPESIGMTWRYDHTEYWTTTEAVYGIKTSINSKGELVTSYGITGYETVEHSRDVYDCLPRR